ncbi:unnamed protein product [Discosporangium mesarthrocarpum]
MYERLAMLGLISKTVMTHGGGGTTIGRFVQVHLTKFVHQMEIREGLTPEVSIGSEIVERVIAYLHRAGGVGTFQPFVSVMAALGFAQKKQMKYRVRKFFESKKGDVTYPVAYSLQNCRTRSAKGRCMVKIQPCLSLRPGVQRDPNPRMGEAEVVTRSMLPREMVHTRAAVAAIQSRGNQGGTVDLVRSMLGITSRGTQKIFNSFAIDPQRFRLTRRLEQRKTNSSVAVFFWDGPVDGSISMSMPTPKEEGHEGPNPNPSSTSVGVRAMTPKREAVRASPRVWVNYRARSKARGWARGRGRGRGSKLGKSFIRFGEGKAFHSVPNGYI